MPLMNIPENFPFTAEQAAMLACCCKDTIITNTTRIGSRYFLASRRSTPKAPLKIMAIDLVDFLTRTQRGYLPPQNDKR
jgi:hypothetical protein